ncbi:hypothetical protein CJ231_09130 [Hoylesella buccalis]|uniref:Uncharacterized protein n=1 Tax=Hoylesella buccalis TaxID=28127 RepID=A0A2N6QPT9_9BACT|nr:hypothetical protein CJ231_09130 [Hoylesella buccalis]
MFMKYVLLSFGFFLYKTGCASTIQTSFDCIRLAPFLVQNVSSFSRVARYTPSLSCILTSKISSKSNKANL